MKRNSIIGVRLGLLGKSHPVGVAVVLPPRICRCGSATAAPTRWALPAVAIVFACLLVSGSAAHRADCGGAGAFACIAAVRGPGQDGRLATAGRGNGQVTGPGMAGKWQGVAGGAGQGGRAMGQAVGTALRRRIARLPGEFGRLGGRQSRQAGRAVFQAAKFQGAARPGLAAQTRNCRLWWRQSSPALRPLAGACDRCSTRRRTNWPGLAPTDVVAPAELLFYQGVVYYRLLNQEKGMKAIDATCWTAPRPARGATWPSPG